MKHTVGDNAVMIAELTIRPERRDAFFEYALGNLEYCRSYAGNIGFDILVDPARPNTVIFYEVWESPEAQQAYMASRVRAGEFTALLEFLAAEPKLTALRRV